MDKSKIIELMKIAGLSSFTDADIEQYMQDNNIDANGQAITLGQNVGASMTTDINTDITSSKQVTPVTGTGSDITALDSGLSSAINMKPVLGQVMDKIKPTAIAGATMLGQGLTATSLMGNNPNVGGAVGGGLLQGAVSGGKAFGPAGAIIGGALGGTMGYVGAMNKKTAIDYARDEEARARRLGATVMPTKFAVGGEITDKTGNVGVQTELNERVIMPDGDIVLVKASELHKDMKKDKITDFLPEGAVVFSAKDSKGMLIDPAKYKDEVIGYGIANYDENDLNPKPIKEIKFGDILGDKPLSPSEALEKIRLKYSTVADRKDIFATATNNENKRARVPFISILAMEQAKKNGSLSPQQFGYGGGVRVRKFAVGSTVGGPPIDPNCKAIDANGNCIDPMPGVVTENVDTGGPLNSYYAQTNAVPFNKNVLNTPLHIINKNANDAELERKQQALVDAQTQRGIEVGAEPATLSPTSIANSKVQSVAAGQTALTPQRVDVAMQTPEQMQQRRDEIEANRKWSDRYDELQKNADAFNSASNLDKAYAPINAQMDKVDELTQSTYDKDKAAISDLMTKNRGSAGLQSMVNLGVAGMQDPTVVTNLQTPYFIEDRFRGMSPAQLDNQVSQLRQGVHNTIAELMDRGMSPTQAAAMASPMIEKANEAEGNLRGKFYQDQMVNDRAKYTELSKIREESDTELARAKQQRIKLSNETIKQMGGVADNWLKANTLIDSKELDANQKADANFNTNQQVSVQNRIDMVSKKQEEQRHLGQRAQDVLDRFTQQREDKEKQAKEQAKKDAEIQKAVSEADFVKSGYDANAINKPRSISPSQISQQTTVANQNTNKGKVAIGAAPVAPSTRLTANDVIPKDRRKAADNYWNDKRDPIKKGDARYEEIMAEADALQRENPKLSRIDAQYIAIVNQMIGTNKINKQDLVKNDFSGVPVQPSRFLKK